MRDGFEISQLNHKEKAYKTIKKKKTKEEKITRIIISKELKKSVDPT